MHTCESETTIDDVEIQVHGVMAYSVEVTCKIEGQPEEARTHEYPGCPAQANVWDFTVDKVYLMNSQGREWATKNKRACEIVKAALLATDWMGGQDDWAIEQLSEHEVGLYELAQEAKAERRREQSWD